MKTRNLIILLGVLILFILGLKLFASDPMRVERIYSKGAYPLIYNLFSLITNQIPFTFFEWVVAILVILQLWILVKWLVLWIRKKRRVLNALGNAALRTGVFLALVYVWFLLTWGLNYSRTGLTSKLDPEPKSLEQEHFLAGSRWASEKISALYRAGASQQDADQAISRVLSALDGVIENLDEPVRFNPIRIKHFVWQYPADSTLTYGIISPFTLEAHLSKSLFPEEQPFYAAHEAAHLRGYASETDANILAFEACLMSKDPLAQFSAYLCAHAYLFSPLSREERGALYQSWPQGLKDLMKGMRKRNEERRGFVSQWSGWFYDLYLKANKQEGGVRTYSAAGAWILRLHFKELFKK